MGYYANMICHCYSHQLWLYSYGLGFQLGGAVNPGSGSLGVQCLLQRGQNCSSYFAGAAQLEESGLSAEQLGWPMSGSSGEGITGLKKKVCLHLNSQHGHGSSLGHTHMPTRTSTHMHNIGAGAQDREKIG